RPGTPAWGSSASNEATRRERGAGFRARKLQSTDRPNGQSRAGAGPERANLHYRQSTDLSYGPLVRSQPRQLSVGDASRARPAIPRVGELEDLGWRAQPRSVGGPHRQ